MANPSKHQLFDIDLDELDAIQKVVGANEAQVLKSYNRALRRTATTLKSKGSKIARDEIQAKKLKYIRNRLKDFIVRESGDLNSLKLWFGLNDMANHTLKGRMRQNGTNAIFTPSSSSLGQQSYPRGFILTGGQLGNTKMMFQRFGRQRGKYHIARTPIAASVADEIEDKLHSQVTDIFINHFVTDLKGRVKMDAEKGR